MKIFSKRIFTHDELYNFILSETFEFSPMQKFILEILRYLDHKYKRCRLGYKLKTKNDYLYVTSYYFSKNKSSKIERKKIKLETKSKHMEVMKRLSTSDDNKIISDFDDSEEYNDIVNKLKWNWYFTKNKNYIIQPHYRLRSLCSNLEISNINGFRYVELPDNYVFLSAVNVDRNKNKSKYAISIIAPNTKRLKRIINF